MQLEVHCGYNSQATAPARDPQPECGDQPTTKGGEIRAEPLVRASAGARGGVTISLREFKRYRSVLRMYAGRIRTGKHRGIIDKVRMAKGSILPAATHTIYMLEFLGINFRQMHA